MFDIDPSTICRSERCQKPRVLKLEKNVDWPYHALGSNILLSIVKTLYFMFGILINILSLILLVSSLQISGKSYEDLASVRADVFWFCS